MKKLIRKLGAGILAGYLALAPQSFAEEPKPKAQIEAPETIAQKTEEQEQASKEKESKLEFPLNFCARNDVLSKYIFRGFTYSDKPVSQGYFTGSWKNFSLTGFGNLDLNKKEVNELDLMADIVVPAGKNFTLLGGYGLFTFPNIDLPKTQEVYAGAKWDGPVTLAGKLIYDFEEGSGLYGEASVSKEHRFGESKRFGLAAAVKAAYNHRYYTKGSGISHLELMLTAPTVIKGDPSAENVSVTPIAAYSFPIEKGKFEKDIFKGGFYYGSSILFVF